MRAEAAGGPRKLRNDSVIYAVRNILCHPVEENEREEHKRARAHGPDEKCISEY
jgi:hypothetical protein